MISDKVDELRTDGTLKDEITHNHLIKNAEYSIGDCSSKIFIDFNIDSILSKFSNLSRAGVLGSGGLYQISQLEKPIKLTKMIDTLRIHEYHDVTSDDFHQFFY